MIRKTSVLNESRRDARPSRRYPDQPTWHRIYQFRTRIPNQTFVAVVGRTQESSTLVARKTVVFLVAAFSLFFTASHSHAGLGWTLEQFEQQYGKPVLDKQQIAGRTGYTFTGEDYIITAFFLKRRVSRIMYLCRGGSVFSWFETRALLGANAPDAVWADASKDEADNSYRVNGTKDGMETYYASLDDEGTKLVIWTKDDDEAGKTTPRLNTPPLSSVMGSNERSTDATSAGPTPSVESGITPAKNLPGVHANATSRTPSQRSDSAQAAHTKTLKRHRSSRHPRYVDVKTRLIALWHRSLRHEKSRDLTRFSKVNKGASKKAGYHAETRH